MNIEELVKKKKAELKAAVAEDTERSKEVLVEVMGDDLSTITAITYVQEKGKFTGVEAPEHAKEKLRRADLLIE